MTESLYIQRAAFMFIPNIFVVLMYSIPLLLSTKAYKKWIDTQVIWDYHQYLSFYFFDKILFQYLFFFGLYFYSEICDWYCIMCPHFPIELLTEIFKAGIPECTIEIQLIWWNWLDVKLVNLTILQNFHWWYMTNAAKIPRKRVGKLASTNVVQISKVRISNRKEDTTLFAGQIIAFLPPQWLGLIDQW